MIVKQLSRSRPTFGQLLSYICDEKKWSLNQDKVKGFVLKHNIRGNSIPQWVAQFKSNEKNFRRVKRVDSVYMYHEILSWNDNRLLTVEKMKDMVEHYIKIRNPRAIYIAVPHFDKQYHVHICCSGIEYQTGKSTRLSKSGLKELQKAMQEYQQLKYPELSNSVVNYGKSLRKSLSDKEYRVKQKYSQDLDKEKIKQALKDCFSNVNSKQKFIDLLLSRGITLYHRGGKPYGIIFNKRRFRLQKFGYSEEVINGLDIAQSRSNDLTQIRNLKKHKELSRDKNATRLR